MTTSTGEAVQFWILTVVAVAGALGTVGARKAVYSAVCLATTMLALAVFYLAQGALFLGVVQVVVYTGAVMTLFLFVLMLIGVDSSESLVETLRGQRVASIGVGLGFGVLLIGGIGHATILPAHPQPENAAGNVSGLAELIFIRYVWAFELTGALLITATIGAMVLAHRERLTERKGQRELSVERFANGRSTPLPTPGVFARNNAVDVPALRPDGSPEPMSVSSLYRDAVDQPRAAHTTRADNSEESR